MRPLTSFVPAALFLAALTLSAPASALTVFDPSSYAKLVAQLDQMAKQYQQQLQQLNQAIQQTGAITGTRNMGSIANSSMDADLRRYLPPDWQSTMNMIGAGDLTGSATETQSLYSSLYTTYAPVTGAAAITRDPTGPLAQALDRKTETTYAAMAASEQAYNSITPRIATYETLLHQLNTTTDLKASVDLQSRIAAENGMILNELLRLNSIQIQQKAAEDNQQLMTFRQASQANRFDATQAQNAFRQGE
jgi:type IV secretion system protein VirB5